MASWKKVTAIGACALFSIIMVARRFRAQIQSNGSYLQAAAQAYRNAAAQCQNPAGAACLRQFAAYENCVANGGNCGNQPTCSTSCAVGSNSSASLSPLLMSGTSAAGAKAQEYQSMGQLFGLGLSLLLNHHSKQDQSQVQDDPVADAAAQSAALQQEQTAEADNVLALSDQIMGSLNTNAAPPASAQASGASVVDSLLDDGPRANTSTAEISALLGGEGSEPDSGTQAPAPDSTATI